MLLHTPPIVNMHHDEMRRYTGRPPSLLDARSSRHLPESAHAPNQRRSRKNSYRHPRVCRTAVSGQGGGPHPPLPDSAWRRWDVRRGGLVLSEQGAHGTRTAQPDTTDTEG